jgi:hypothetical protein
VNRKNDSNIAPGRNSIQCLANSAEALAKAFPPVSSHHDQSFFVYQPAPCPREFTGKKALPDIK